MQFGVALCGCALHELWISGSCLDAGSTWDAIVERIQKHNPATSRKKLIPVIPQLASGGISSMKYIDCVIQ